VAAKGPLQALEFLPGNSPGRTNGLHQLDVDRHSTARLATRPILTSFSRVVTGSVIAFFTPGSCPRYILASDRKLAFETRGRYIHAAAGCHPNCVHNSVRGIFGNFPKIFGLIPQNFTISG
jgi:hypothetical protein